MRNLFSTVGQAILVYFRVVFYFLSLPFRIVYAILAFPFRK